MTELTQRWITPDVRSGSATLYVIEARPHHERGQLHTLTARYLLARSVVRGDTVAAALTVSWTLEPGAVPGDQLLRLRIPRSCYDPELGEHVGVRVLSHPGRSAMLGEDTLDGEPSDLLAAVALEVATGHPGWEFAPCHLEVRTADEADDDAHEYVHLAAELRLAVDLGSGNRTAARPPSAWLAEGYCDRVDGDVHAFGTDDPDTWGRAVLLWVPIGVPPATAHPVAEL